MGAKNVVIIPNGVDVAKFQFQRSNVKGQMSKVIVTVSRLVEKNGISDLIVAMQYLPMNYKLLIIGSGPLERVLKLQVESLKLGERVTFSLEVPHGEVPKYLHESDIFCRPSISEGFGNVFVEAMAAGLPVITTPVGGIVDFLRDKETGLFCKVNNPKSIADSVLLLEEQPALREAIIAGGLRMVRERYDWNIISNKMRGVFEKL